MRKTLSLVLALALLLTMGLAALAEASVDEIEIDAVEDVGAISLDETLVPDEDVPLILDDEAILLSDDLALALPEAPEALGENASVPTKLTLGVGESYTLKVSGAKKYSSSNKACATVSSKGVVKAKATGSATITVTMKSGSPLKVKVTVKAAPKSVKLNKAKLTLQVGATYQLKATLPSKTASAALKWSSNKKSVAKVSASGLVTAVKAGTAVITVETFNGQTATCTVTVKTPTKKAGISLPTKDLQRWKQDGANMKSLLKKAGYTVDLRYAANDVNTQKTQIEAMIKGGCSALVIAAIDGNSLGDTLKKAGDAGIPVIAYDRLIVNSDAVSYYVTFDNYQVGVLQGNYIKKVLKLDSAKGPFNIEFTAGDPGDSNAKVFFQGAVDVLNPYIKSGKLKVPSGQKTFSKVATKYWDTATASERAGKVLASKYADGAQLHAWLCSNDTTALGVIAALEANYTGQWPVVTGQDCDIENVKAIINGKQAMSVFKDTAVLAKQTAKMVGQILKGKKVSVNNTTSYDNGAKVVPAYLCTPLTVTASNYKKVLIDGGYYTAEMLKD